MSSVRPVGSRSRSGAVTLSTPSSTSAPTATPAAPRAISPSTTRRPTGAPCTTVSSEHRPGGPVNPPGNPFDFRNSRRVGGGQSGDDDGGGPAGRWAGGPDGQPAHRPIGPPSCRLGLGRDVAPCQAG